MHRFFCAQADISGDKIIIADIEQVHHIKNVLRLKAKEEVVVVDENGNEYHCVISDLKDNILLAIKNKTLSGKKDNKVKLTIACAIPKKAKIDDIIDKLVQLGVDRIIPLKTERVIVKLDKPKEDLRALRWKKIALCACKQSQRNSLAMIDPVTDFKEVIMQSSGFDLKIIPHLEGKRKSLKGILEEFFGDGSQLNRKASPSRGEFSLPDRQAGFGLRTVPKIIVLIGPEGDFSATEVALAIKAGFIPVTLGDLVLRVDTAAISAASFIRLFTS